VDWVKLSARYYLDVAIANLPDADTEVMFTRALAYAGDQETGGWIPTGMLPAFCRNRRYEASARALVAAGLWLPAKDGYQIVRWQEWQSELDAIAHRRSADRDRKRRERSAKAKAQLNGMSRDMSEDGHADNPQDCFSSLRSTTGGIETRDNPPNPPQAGGHGCARHKRPRATCADCTKPPPAASHPSARTVAEAIAHATQR